MNVFDFVDFENIPSNIRLKIQKYYHQVVSHPNKMDDSKFVIKQKKT